MTRVRFQASGMVLGGDRVHTALKHLSPTSIYHLQVSNARSCLPPRAPHHPGHGHAHTTVAGMKCHTLSRRAGSNMYSCNVTLLLSVSLESNQGDHFTREPAASTFFPFLCDSTRYRADITAQARLASPQTRPDDTFPASLPRRVMSQPPIPSLKRPRSTSDPPSPSSSSSPKRAPSEDVYPASSDSGRNDLVGGSNANGNGNGWLSPSMQNGPGSSPLRDADVDGNANVDVDGDVDVDDDATEAWVKRTEDVHLDGDVGEEEREQYKERYNELLGESTSSKALADSSSPTTTLPHMGKVLRRPRLASLHTQNSGVWRRQSRLSL
jgi:hypothetical protein